MNMKSTVTVILASTALSALSGCGANAEGEEATRQIEAAVHNGDDEEEFRLKSPDFQAGDPLPYEATCQDGLFGTGVSPKLRWTKGPEGTESYAIVLKDETAFATVGANFAFHWAMWNIPADLRKLVDGIPGLNADGSADANPFPEGMEGAEQVQARGAPRYFAPCPAWAVTLNERCGLPPAERANDTYSIILYALPEANLEVPEHDPGVNPNYVDRLNMIFEGMMLDKTVLTTTSDAIPSAVPFACPE